MSNLSTVIEKFILDTIGGDDSMIISRNALAEHFDCAPSQINYVLSTRFTPERGFIVGGKRGGGGYIEIVKIKHEKDEYINNLVCERIGGEISYSAASRIIEKLFDDKIISQNERNIIAASVADKALQSPFPISSAVRAKILKNILITLLNKEKD